MEYIVMDIEQIKHEDKKIFPGQGTISNKVSFRSVQNIQIVRLPTLREKRILMSCTHIQDKNCNFQHVIADVWLVKASELGINDNPTHTRTHLGHVLKPGDSVFG